MITDPKESMKLITKAIEKLITKYPMRSQDGVEDKTIICKFFYPWGDGTFYVTEGEKLDNGDYEFFGLVRMNGFKEWGYFTLSQLISVVKWGCLTIERDKYFDPIKMSECSEIKY